MSNDTNVTCVSVNSTLMINCASYISYLIPSTYNQSVEDQAALSFNQDSSQCPYYTPLPYQCRKHFPSCTTTNTNGTSTTVLVKVCTSSCYEGMTWMNGICQRFSDDYFNNECGQDRYYANLDPPQCAISTTPLPPQSWWWKVVLVSLLGLIGIVLLGSYIRTRLRERMTMEDLDREDEQRAARRAASNAPRGGRRFGKGRGEAYLPLTADETEMETVHTEAVPATTTTHSTTSITFNPSPAAITTATATVEPHLPPPNRQISPPDSNTVLPSGGEV